MKFEFGFRMTYFRAQLALLVLLAGGTWAGLAMNSQIGAFVAGINVGGMLYIVVNLRFLLREWAHDRALREALEITRATFNNPRFKAVIEKLSQLPPDGRETPKEQSQRDQVNR